MKYSVSSRKYNGICQHFVPKLFPGPRTRGNVKVHRARTRKHKQTTHDTIIHVYPLLRANNDTACCMIKKLVNTSIKIGLTSRFRRVSFPAQRVVLWSGTTCEFVYVYVRGPGARWHSHVFWGQEIVSEQNVGRHQYISMRTHCISGLIKIPSKQIGPFN